MSAHTHFFKNVLMRLCFWHCLMKYVAEVPVLQLVPLLNVWAARLSGRDPTGNQKCPKLAIWTLLVSI